MLRVNVLGGWDVGKTTVAMHAVAELRWLGVPTALSCGISKFWGVDPAIVSIRVHDRHPNIWTPHSLAELCQDSMTFLVLRRKDYKFDWLSRKSAAADDEQLEMMMREGRVRYKSLPGVRASVPYIVKKICERIGYGK